MISARKAFFAQRHAAARRSQWWQAGPREARVVMVGGRQITPFRAITAKLRGETVYNAPMRAELSRWFNYQYFGKRAHHGA